MQIKQQALAQYLQKKIAPFYMLIGQDNYLLEEAFVSIKSAIKSNLEVTEKSIVIQSPEDWAMVIEEANSYSLFAEITLLNIYIDKKSIEAAGKKLLTEYLQASNPRCYLIIRAPNIPAKQLLWLDNLEQTVIVLAYPMAADAIKNWIAARLKERSFTFDINIPTLIQQYTQGNMLACAQVMEKFTLLFAENSHINEQNALEQLTDQCDLSSFELAEACLMGKTAHAIHLLRKAANNKSESPLILWVLSQEIRTLLQLHYSLQQKIDFKTACSQLKIWPQRVSMYQSALKRVNINMLNQLMHYSQRIDARIKSNLNTQVWNNFEMMVIALSLGQLTGELCVL